MPHSTKSDKFNLETPASYRIRVQGAIHPEWLDLMGGMRVGKESTTDKGTVTTLVGRMADQAALSGVLKTLYDLRIPILSVENLDEKNGELP